ncbi:hypothetical protein [Streptomyces heilongjiangensis]|uniref:Transmembrane protein n=1 Tax=Streptomyces heilongjiangensis TaxID=945052 RepID=A0ABW1AZL6_9ACTN|nr:hypothetical protein [Streptomyces heilongjiangensis]MDC2946507.1 hypothetical protein [Streptomyces heilongjiangensis]
MSARNSPHASGSPPPHQEHVSRGANPLRRTSDRFESWFRALLMLVLVLGLPVAAISAGRTAYESSMRTVETQSAQRHQVTARLMSTVKEITGGREQAQVRWTDDQGRARTGTTLVKAGTAKGAAVRVWVDRDGGLTGPPMSGLNATTTGWFMGGMAALGVGAGFYVVRAGMGRVLDRRRYARWAAEWERVEPVWSARFRR